MNEFAQENKLKKIQMVRFKPLIICLSKFFALKNTSSVAPFILGLDGSKVGARLVLRETKAAENDDPNISDLVDRWIETVSPTNQIIGWK